MARTKKKNGADAAPMTTSQMLGSLLKSARDIMRKDKGLNGDLDRLREALIGYRDQALRTADEAAAHAEGAQREDAWRFSGIALEWSERFSRDEAARIDWLIERLRGMR